MLVGDGCASSVGRHDDAKSQYSAVLTLTSGCFEQVEKFIILPCRLNTPNLSGKEAAR
jgi:hypothetical protein